MPKHEWSEIRFTFASWLECSCGVEAHSQEDLDKHNREVIDSVLGEQQQ
jgi:hypothetical protein